MRDQQPHTPTTGFIQSRYEAGRLALDGADTARLTTAERSAEFDRWLASIEAAAEQRGAARGKAEGYDTALNEVASRGLISIDVHDLLNLNNPYRTDLVGGRICGLDDCESDEIAGHMQDGTLICYDCARDGELEGDDD